MKKASLNKTVTLRFTPEQLEKIEARAREIRLATGEPATNQTVLRELVDKMKVKSEKKVK